MVTWQPINDSFGKEIWKKGPIEYQSSFYFVNEALSQKMSSVKWVFPLWDLFKVGILSKIQKYKYVYMNKQGW